MYEHFKSIESQLGNVQWQVMTGRTSDGKCWCRHAVSMKITAEDSKRCNIAPVCKRLKTVSKRRGVNKMKSFWLNLVYQLCVRGASHTWDAYSIQGDKVPVQSQQLVRRDNWWRWHRTPNFLEDDLVREEIWEFLLGVLVNNSPRMFNVEERDRCVSSK